MKMCIKNFIDGQWVDSRAGKTFERSNPANTAEEVAVVSKADTGDVEEALKATYGV